MADRRIGGGDEEKFVDFKNGVYYFPVSHYPQFGLNLSEFIDQHSELEIVSVTKGETDCIHGTGRREGFYVICRKKSSPHPRGDFDRLEKTC